MTGSGPFAIPAPGGSPPPGPAHPAVLYLEVQPSGPVLHGDDRTRRQRPYRGPAAPPGEPFGVGGIQADVPVRIVLGLRWRSGNRCHTATLAGPGRTGEAAVPGHISVTASGAGFCPKSVTRAGGFRSAYRGNRTEFTRVGRRLRIPRRKVPQWGSGRTRGAIPRAIRCGATASDATWEIHGSSATAGRVPPRRTARRSTGRPLARTRPRAGAAGGRARARRCEGASERWAPRPQG